MKSILWVTGVFPPINIGIGRQAKIAKYLPQHGWNPIVLAFDKSMFRPQYDETMLKDIEHLTVHRTKSGESELLQSTLPMYLRMLGIKTKWWSIPDPWIRWKKQALKEWWWIRYSQALKEQPIQAIFSSGPPHTCHLVGLEIKQETGLPWIVDYRDVWTQEDKSYANKKSQKQVELNEEMEEAVLRNADWVTLVNEVVLEMLRSKFPFIRDKSSCITHGYDPEDYEDMKPVERPYILKDTCIMTFTGTLYGERTKGAEAFLKALKQFYDENPKAELKVQFMGNCRAVESMARDLGLCDRAGYRVAFIPWADKKQAISMMAASDILLFILGESPLDRHASTGKIFDYFGVGKPILAVAPEGVATRMLEEVGGAIVASPTDIDGIAQAIKIASKPKSIEGGSTEQYSVKNKAKEMAEVLERVTK